METEDLTYILLQFWIKFFILLKEYKKGKKKNFRLTVTQPLSHSAVCHAIHASFI